MGYTCYEQNVQIGGHKMTLGEKLSKLRKENNYTQEQLASILEVSRQAISKWESNITYPETEKLVRLSELFNCSMDYLLKNTEKTDGNQQRNQQTSQQTELVGKHFHERKSEKTMFGMPLWHVDKNARGFFAVGLNARGIIAIGLKAKGFVSIGMLSIGVLSLGMLSLGMLSLGMLAMGILATGCFSVGIFSFGAISLGIISVGAIAIGNFSIGALSIGKYFAFGDNASAMIAVGGSKAAGSIFHKIGELSTQDFNLIKQSLDTVVPTYLSWAKEIIKLFL